MKWVLVVSATSCVPQSNNNFGYLCRMCSNFILLVYSESVLKWDPEQNICCVGIMDWHVGICAVMNNNTGKHDDICPIDKNARCNCDSWREAWTILHFLLTRPFSATRWIFIFLFKELRGRPPEVGSKNLIKNKVRSNYANPPHSAGGALKSLSKPNNKNAGPPSHTVTSGYLLVVFFIRNKLPL